MKPAPLPIIDLHGKFQVIDTETNRWKTVGTGVASETNARKLARKLGLPGIWIYDGLGDGFDRRYVTV